MFSRAYKLNFLYGCYFGDHLNGVISGAGHMKFDIKEYTNEPNWVQEWNLTFSRVYKLNFLHGCSVGERLNGVISGAGNREFGIKEYTNEPNWL